MNKQKISIFLILASIILSLLATVVYALNVGEFSLSFFATIIFSLIFDAAFAQEFGAIAEQKGHSYIRYVRNCFLFTIIGYLMVIALPDRGNQSKAIPDELPDL